MSEEIGSKIFHEFEPDILSHINVNGNFSQSLLAFCKEKKGSGNKQYNGFINAINRVNKKEGRDFSVSDMDFSFLTTVLLDIQVRNYYPGNYKDLVELLFELKNARNHLEHLPASYYKSKEEEVRKFILDFLKTCDNTLDFLLKDTFRDHEYISVFREAGRKELQYLKDDLQDLYKDVLCKDPMHSHLDRIAVGNASEKYGHHQPIISASISYEFHFSIKLGRPSEDKQEKGKNPKGIFGIFS